MKRASLDLQGEVIYGVDDDGTEDEDGGEYDADDDDVCQVGLLSGRQKAVYRQC